MNQLVLILLFVMVGCTTISYTSDGTMPVELRERSEFKSKIFITGQKEFYLWGLTPDYHEVKIDKLLEREGIFAGSQVEIKEYQSLASFLKSLFTFGMYIPMDYEITGMGKRSRDND